MKKNLVTLTGCYCKLSRPVVGSSEGEEALLEPQLFQGIVGRLRDVAVHLLRGDSLGTAVLSQI